MEESNWVNMKELKEMFNQAADCKDYEPMSVLLPLPSSLTEPRLKHWSKDAFTSLCECGMINNIDDILDVWTHPDHGIEVWRLVSGALDNTQQSIVSVHLQTAGYTVERNETMPVTELQKGLMKNLSPDTVLQTMCHVFDTATEANVNKSSYVAAVSIVKLVQQLGT